MTWYTDGPVQSLHLDHPQNFLIAGSEVTISTDLINFYRSGLIALTRISKPANMLLPNGQSLKINGSVQVFESGKLRSVTTATDEGLQTPGGTVWSSGVDSTAITHQYPSAIEFDESNHMISIRCPSQKHSLALKFENGTTLNCDSQKANCINSAGVESAWPGQIRFGPEGAASVSAGQKDCLQPF